VGQAAAEKQLVEALRAGDETAFRELVRQYQPSLVRVARIYVSSQATAEEVAQETWLGVLNGLDRFEGRSSLRTWIFRILTNIAKTRAVRDGRTLPFSALVDPGRVPEAAVDSQRAVISLRDIEGWSSEEVRNARELSETNQRVLLHRARSKVRAALEEYLKEAGT